MAVIKCPKCKSTNIDHIGGKIGASLNLNPLHPLTLVNHKPKGKQLWHCRDCGKEFKAKM